MKKLLKQIFFILLSFVLIVSMSCSKADKNPEKPSINGEKKVCKVFVSVLPQKFLVEAVCGEYVKVSVMVGPGQKLYEYKPTSKQISELSKCDYYVKIGLPFEDMLVEKASAINPNLKFIDSIKGIDRMQIMINGKKEADTYVWLSPQLDKQMIKNIYEFFIEADPEHFEYYKNEYEMVSISFDDIDAQIRDELAPYKGRSFIVFNPVLWYFARDYGLQQKSIEFKKAVLLSEKILKIAEDVKKENIKIIFVEPQFDKTADKSLAKAINGDVVIIDPFKENIPNNLINIMRSLKKSFEQK